MCEKKSTVIEKSKQEIVSEKSKKNVNSEDLVFEISEIIQNDL